ncbi:nucleotidyl transferase AbiEii/AbiGii toxin family protein [Myceligenerans pegani]|uniref:Nucleotidyl transferase AbiEii/AbiGii toxin family protein n=1 Tax=Myceligenerans pegani TaxID=2776917 RepID=A0ABR9MY20_9MICO|nr:nucleotidyl transferase AbiEii/AbiGii toxin family protein [Myceligenerans sp. TRM 65318]MBE1875692.1 nucleotidyl transferase AbiEii/AbiGii toxin family protein [Myceligenerans sp. TRM 65318]MBE3017963.1 nucleotidyl transferase AbiEii/AbiGii toxin family protein [Myceligenerans sp. TRM 65318]
MQSVNSVLAQAASDLDAIGAQWAVIGGLAVALRAEPRFTRDVDIAIAVSDDAEAEAIVNRMQVRGYALSALVEQDYTDRLSTVRLIRPQAGTATTYVDLLFASSGIESEIVSHADRLEILPGTDMPVASTGHLIALKVLAGRHQDQMDLGYLLAAASDDDLTLAQKGIELIHSRGYNRGLDLKEQLAAAIQQSRPSDQS